MDEKHKQEEDIKDDQNQVLSENELRSKPIPFFIKYKKRILIVGILLLISIYAFGCFYYQDKFLPRTTFNDVNVAGLTEKGAFQQLEKHLTQSSLVLTFIDGKQESISQKDCGLSFDSSTDIQKELKKQNSWLWLIHWFYEDQIDVKNLLTVDEEQMQKTVSQLQHLQADQQVVPADAKVEYKDNKFSIVKEEIGSTIQTDTLLECILNAFNEGQTELNVEESQCYQMPKIKEDDKSLENLKTVAQKYCQASITYKTINGDVVLDGNTLMKWLSIDESGNYYKDDQEFEKQATAFVKELSQKINIIGKKKTFIGANNREVSVTGGNYGYQLNQEKEVKGLLEDINVNKHETRTPVTTGIQASYENGGLGDTFVEIDMTKQHFWLHKNGKVVLESDVVTGLPSNPNKKTPAGTYYIYFMQLNRTLRGAIQANGKPEYETPVAYWMAFNKGIGLHDATWQSKFGGNVYYSKGSHGCINLPLDIAGQLYDMVKVNTPVVCYY